MSDPVPAGDYGTATWQDFNNNWRKKDADFLQSRSVLRYDTTAARDAITPAPAAGTTIYNFQTDRIEYRTKTATWNALYHVNGLVIEQVASDHMVRHPSNASGLLFTPTQMVAQVPLVTAGNELKFETSGLTISTGDKDAKLTTDATSLLSDTPITAPGFTSTGAVTAVNATVSNHLTMNGTSTFTGLVTALGQITVGAAPTATNHVANKSYVDFYIGGRVPMVGTSTTTPMTGPLCVKATGPGVRISSTDSAPYIDFFNSAWTQLGYIQCTSAVMNIVTDGDITLNSGGGQVRCSDSIFASGTGSRFYSPAQQIICVGADPYLGFYNGSGVDSYGARAGFVGFTSDNYMHLYNQQANSSIMYDTAFVHSFRSSGVECLRIANGFATIGKTAADTATEGHVLWNNGSHYTTTTTGNAANLYLNTINKAHSERWIWFGRNGGWIGSIYQNGTSGAVFATTCDYRTKTIIGPIKDATDRLMSLKPYRVTWNSDPERGETDDFMAHEVAEIVPDAVIGEKDAVDEEGNEVHQQMGEARLTALIVAALQDTIGRVDVIERNLPSVLAA